MKYYYGIDIGGSAVKIGLVDEDYNILAKGKVPNDKKTGKQLCSDVAAAFKELLSEVGLKESDIVAGGIGSPGMIDSKEGIVHFAGNLGWVNEPLAKEMSDALGVPVSVCNDANCAVLGELVSGAGVGVENLLLITIGTGIGSGIVVDGKLFEGGRSAGAEAGHMMLIAGGRPCSCGRRGCFETYASAKALENESGMSVLDFLDKVRSGDDAALKLWDEYTSYLAEGIISASNLFRPDLVLLGGGISGAGELLVKPVREKVQAGIFTPGYAVVEVAAAKLGNTAGIIGAVAYMRQMSR